MVTDISEYRLELARKNGVTEADLLVHDEIAEEPYLALMLSRMFWPAFPVPVGVLRARGRHLGQELPVAGGVDGQPVGRLEAPPAGDQRSALGGGAQLFAVARRP